MPDVTSATSRLPATSRPADFAVYYQNCSAARTLFVTRYSRLRTP